MIFRLLAVVFQAVLAGKLAAKLKMPAVLGFLIAGMAFSPYGLNLLTQEILDKMVYHTLISFLERRMGLILGREMVWRKMRSYGKQIVVVTLATAPALSIVAEYKTDGPVTKALIPMPIPILNFMLSGMVYSAVFVNLLDKARLESVMRYCTPAVNACFTLIILNLGAPLDYHPILGAGVFTAVYIIARSARMISPFSIGKRRALSPCLLGVISK